MLEWVANHSKTISAVASIGSFFIWLVYAQLLYHNFRRQRRPRVLINRGKSKGIDSLCIISNMSAESIFIEHIVAQLDTNCGSLLMDVTELERNYQHGDEHGNNIEGTDGDHTDGRQYDTGKSNANESASATSSAPSSTSQHSSTWAESSQSAQQGRVKVSDMRIVDTTRQGPLQSGDFLHIGTFAEVVERLARSNGVDLDGHWPCHEKIEFQRLTLRIIGIYGSEDHPIGVERSFKLRNGEGVCDLLPEHWDSRRLSSRRQRHKLKKLLQRMSGEDISARSTFVHPDG